MNDIDVLIVGCGITGAVIARRLAEKGKRVIIWERRDHIAGNMYDYVDEHGILVHKYGPHIFHTNDDEVWKFVNQYGKWKPFKLVCGASWGGKYTPTAFNFKTIDTFYPADKANKLNAKLLEASPGMASATVVEVLSNKDKDIREFAEYLFENDYAPYTAKQWGVTPNEIDPSVLKRVPIRFSYDESYFTDKYEAMPYPSYKSFIKNILTHKNIQIQLGVDALTRLKLTNDKIYVDGEEVTFKIVYTGALDELFNFEFGELPYRSLRFEWKYTELESYQEAPVVAYPQEPEFTRITEYKKLPRQNAKGSTYAIEYPLLYIQGNKNEPYYPVLTSESQKVYENYEKRAAQIENLICSGRLAEFKYYNMDQAIKSALKVSERI